MREAMYPLHCRRSLQCIPVRLVGKLHRVGPGHAAADEFRATSYDEQRKLADYGAGIRLFERARRSSLPSDCQAARFAEPDIERSGAIFLRTSRRDTGASLGSPWQPEPERLAHRQRHQGVDSGFTLAVDQVQISAATSVAWKCPPPRHRERRRSSRGGARAVPDGLSVGWVAESIEHRAQACRPKIGMRCLRQSQS